MQMGGQADVHQVHLGIVQQLIEGLVADHLRKVLHSSAPAKIPLNAAPVTPPFLRIPRGDSVYFTTLDLLDCFEMSDSHVTDSHDTDIDHDNLLIQKGMALALNMAGNFYFRRNDKIPYSHCQAIDALQTVSPSDLTLPLSLLYIESK